MRNDLPSGREAAPAGSPAAAGGRLRRLCRRRGGGRPPPWQMRLVPPGAVRSGRGTSAPMAAATPREPRPHSVRRLARAPRPSRGVAVAPAPRPPARVLAAMRCPWRRRARGPRGATAKGGYLPELPGGVAGACSPSRRGAPRRGAASAVSSGGCGRRRRARPGRSHSPVGPRLRTVAPAYTCTGPGPRPPAQSTASRRGRRVRATRERRSRRATVVERQRSEDATGCATDACEPPGVIRRRAARASRGRARTAPEGEPAGALSRGPPSCAPWPPRPPRRCRRPRPPCRGPRRHPAPAGEPR